MKQKENFVWKLHTLMDRASDEDGCDAGLILVSPEGIELTYAVRLEFTSTNNVAEYEALIAGLKLAQRVKEDNLEAHVDSLLVTNQVRDHDTKDPTMASYLGVVKELIVGFKSFQILHIPMSKNKKADELSKLASVAFDHLAKEIRVEVLLETYVNNKEVSCVSRHDQESWMTLIYKYLTSGKVPKNKPLARKISIKALRYEIIEGETL